MTSASIARPNYEYQVGQSSLTQQSTGCHFLTHNRSATWLIDIICHLTFMTFVSSPLREQEFIPLVVVVPGYNLTMIQAPRSASIASLKKCITGSNVELMHKGQIMNNESTLAFYEMQPNDVILALPKKASADLALRVARMGDSMESIAANLTNERSRREYCRLRDLACQRLDSRPRAARKHLTKAVRTATDWGRGPIRQSSMIPDPPLDVSTEPLPVPW
jgi:hypothetical protein